MCQNSKIARQGSSVTQQYYMLDIEGLSDPTEIQNLFAGSLNNAVTITSISFKNIPAPSDEQTWAIYISAGPLPTAAGGDGSAEQTQHAWLVKCDVDKSKQYLRLLPRISIVLNLEPEPNSTEIFISTLVGAFLDSNMLPDSDGGQDKDYDQMYIVLGSDSYRPSLKLDSFTSEANYSDGMAYLGKRFVNYSDWSLLSGIPEYLVGDTFRTETGTWTPSMSTYFTIDSSNTSASYFRFGSIVFYYCSIKITNVSTPATGGGLEDISISGLPYSIELLRTNLSSGMCTYKTSSETLHKYIGVYGLKTLTAAALVISSDMVNAENMNNWPVSAGTLTACGYYFTGAS